MRCEKCKYYGKERTVGGYTQGSHCEARLINEHRDDTSPNPRRRYLTVIRDTPACEYYKYNDEWRRDNGLPPEDNK